MLFSVVTPSFRSSEWLKLCIASVADQQVPVEHIIQDAGSDDGTLGWLTKDSRVRTFVEQDAGMYDAINRGLMRASGDLLSYLNCDEQYLPGALAAVAEEFKRHPGLELLFAHFVVVDRNGKYLFHRKVQSPLRNHLSVAHLPAFSCAMFFRRRLIHERGILFNPKLRAVGDGDWVLKLLKAEVNIRVLQHFTSVFTFHGNNLGGTPEAQREAAAMHASAPAWVRILRPVWICHHRFRKLLSGAYAQAPFNYSIYTSSRHERVTFEVRHPTSRWNVPLP